MGNHHRILRLPSRWGPQEPPKMEVVMIVVPVIDAVVITQRRVYYCEVLEELRQESEILQQGMFLLDCLRCTMLVWIAESQAAATEKTHTKPSCTTVQRVFIAKVPHHRFI